jgi:2-phospho-L-lactate guanylyltransferase
MSQLDDDLEPAALSPGMPRLGWTVVIPVKPAADGKSRLRLPPAHRHAIVRAIALDTIEAAAACDRVARVRVVTADEPLLAAVASHDGVDVVRDSASGLGAAIELGLAVTGTDLARAVLLGDLPALKPRELSDALSLAARHDLAFVPDADGAGTVLATARAGVPFRPLFGVNSAAAPRRRASRNCGCRKGGASGATWTRPRTCPRCAARGSGRIPRRCSVRAAAPRLSSVCRYVDQDHRAVRRSGRVPLRAGPS